MKVKDHKTAEICRSAEFRARYRNLLLNRHNNLRITRILKCLGDMHLELFQIGWIKFLIEEVFVTKELTTLDTSLVNFWVHTVKDDSTRNDLINKVEVIIYYEDK